MMAELLTIPYFHNHLTPKNNEHIHMNLLVGRTSPTHQLKFDKIRLYVVWALIISLPVFNGDSYIYDSFFERPLELSYDNLDKCLQSAKSNGFVLIVEVRRKK